MVSSTVLSRSEPDRKVLFQTQSAAPQSRHAGYRGPVEGNRGFAQYGLPNRMYKLLCLLWICKYLNQRRSRNAPPTDWIPAFAGMTGVLKGGSSQMTTLRRQQCL